MSRQYQNAAKALTAVIINGASLKGYCAKVKLGKLEYALICETLKYNEILSLLFERCEISNDQLDVDPCMLKVMGYELLFGKGKIDGGGVVKRRLLEKIDELQSALQREMKDRKYSQVSDFVSNEVKSSENLPKYVRINEIKMTIQEGLRLMTTVCAEARIDEHIPSLLVLPPTCPPLSDNDMVKNGGLIIQDKASCFPSQILMDEWKLSSEKGDIADACAAPGNKTSHMAALLKMTTHPHTIFAFDRNTTRAKLLTSRMEHADASSVEVQCNDFLKVDVNAPKYENVKAILVDPSCSGSGLVRSLDRIIERKQKNDDDAIARSVQLQKFQIQAVTKAMTFPSADIVVYSTCSIHKEENEDVVIELLRTHPNWKLKLPSRMKSWHRKGLDCEELTKKQSDSLIRCFPEDGMNGFFVALFVKDKSIPPAVVHKEDISTDFKEGKLTSITQTTTVSKNKNKRDQKQTGEEGKRKLGGAVWKPFKKRK